MNIAIDLQPLATKSKKRGMGVYAAGLLDEMFRQDVKNDYFLFNMFGEWEYDLQKLPPNVSYQRFYMGKDNCLLTEKHYSMETYHEKHKKIIRALYKTFIKKHDIDVFLFLTPFEYYSCYDPEWFEDVSTVMVIHDLIPYLFPKQYLGMKGTRVWYEEIMQFVKSADYLLANSQDTKDTTIRYLGFDEKKIDVIYAGIQKEYQKKMYPNTVFEYMRKAFGISGEYIIMPGADDFRKNVSGTIEAYALLPENIRKQYQLVVTGGMCKEFLHNILTLVEQNGLADRVVFTGYVSIENFVMLYNMAKLMVFPSQYEGFGFPVAEAFACGTPVVTSNLGSLSEVAENAAIVVDPYNVDDVAKGIMAGIREYPSKMFAPAVQERLREYTWGNTARKALDTINKAYKKKELLIKKRSRIAVFTSFNLKKKQTHQRNIDYIQALGEYADVDIYTDGYTTDFFEDTINKMIFENFAIRSHEDVHFAPKPYDAFLYQISDDENCWFMFHYLIIYPGVLDLGDENYHSMLCGIAGLNGFDWEVYRTLMYKEVTDVDQYLDDVKNNPALFKKAVSQVCANRFLVDRGQKIIVHTEAEREKLLEKSIGYDVKTFGRDPVDGCLYYKYIIGKDDLGLVESDLEAVQKTLNSQLMDRCTEYKRVAETIGYIFNQEECSHGSYDRKECCVNAINTKEIMRGIYSGLEKKGLDKKTLRYGKL